MSVHTYFKAHCECRLLGECGGGIVILRHGSGQLFTIRVHPIETHRKAPHFQKQEHDHKRLFLTRQD